jgi:hypothetical protein
MLGTGGVSIASHRCGGMEAGAHAELCAGYKIHWERTRWW